MSFSIVYLLSSRLSIMPDFSGYTGRQRLQCLPFSEGVCYGKKNETIRTGKASAFINCIATLAAIPAKKENGELKSFDKFPV